MKKLRTIQRAFFPFASCLLPAYTDKFKNKIGLLYILWLGNMKLSFKDIQFIIEAIDNLIKVYEERLNNENIDEDEISDIGNDCMFLETLRVDFKNNLKKLLPQNQNSLQSELLNLSAQDLKQSVLQLPISQRLVLVDAITESIRQELSLIQR
ncbi:hypothetical protein F8S12_05490 [Nostoc sp. WHI]|nr:hypothetical protein [Nostoc sp. WHI]